MKIWILAVAVMTLAFALPVQAQDPNLTPTHWVGEFRTDARTIDGLAGYKQGVIETGAVVTWFDEQPEHVWAGGAYGLLDVTPDAQFPLRNLIPAVGDWLNLPETLPATLKIGGQVQVINIAHEPQAAGGPLVQAEIGPLTFSFLYRIIEGGTEETGLMDSAARFYFGVRPIRF